MSTVKFKEIKPHKKKGRGNTIRIEGFCKIQSQLDKFKMFRLIPDGLIFPNFLLLHTEHFEYNSETKIKTIFAEK